MSGRVVPSLFVRERVLFMIVFLKPARWADRREAQALQCLMSLGF